MFKSHAFAFSIILLVLITFFSFSPALRNGFVNCDDNVLVTDNPYIRSFSSYNLENIFTKPYFGLYHPLIQISYALEYKFFKLNPAVYHFDNLLLHTINCILAFLMILLLSQNIFVSFLTALLFAVHPMHVESVAWVTERKDVLYSAFFLGSCLGYLHYQKSFKKQAYFISLFLFFFSLLSKIMAVSLPAVLILFDYLNERKGLKNIILDKIPYFVLSAVFGVIALSTHYKPAQAQVINSWFLNLKFAFFGFVFYIYKLILPIHLCFGYSYNAQSFKGLSTITVFPVFVTVILAAGVIYSLKYTKKIAFGTLFYAVTIFPVIQLIPSGQNCPGDRYTYIPFIGLFYIIAEGFNYLREKKKLERPMYALIVIIFAMLSILTFKGVKVWRDSFSLWSNILKTYQNSAKAFKGLGDAYKEKGDFKAALEYYGKAEKERPGYADIYNNRGNLYSTLGDLNKAEKDFSKAIELDPTSSSYFYNRGIIYEKKKRLYKALSDYTMSIKNSPDYAEAYNNRGVVFGKLGLYSFAVMDFKRALKINPFQSEAKRNLSFALYFLNQRRPEAKVSKH